MIKKITDSHYVVECGPKEKTLFFDIKRDYKLEWWVDAMALGNCLGYSKEETIARCSLLNGEMMTATMITDHHDKRVSLIECEGGELYIDLKKSIDLILSTSGIRGEQLFEIMENEIIPTLFSGVMFSLFYKSYMTKRLDWIVDNDTKNYIEDLDRRMEREIEKRKEDKKFEIRSWEEEMRKARITMADMESTINTLQKMIEDMNAFFNSLQEGIKELKETL